jgi:hypothetical protein
MEGPLTRSVTKWAASAPGTYSRRNARFWRGDGHSLTLRVVLSRPFRINTFASDSGPQNTLCLTWGAKSFSTPSRAHPLTLSVCNPAQFSSCAVDVCTDTGSSLRPA